MLQVPKSNPTNQFTSAKNVSALLSMFQSNLDESDKITDCSLLTANLRSLTFWAFIQLEQQPIYRQFLKRDVHLAFKQVRSELNAMETKLVQACPLMTVLDSTLQTQNKGDAETALLMTYLAMPINSELYRRNYLTSRSGLNCANWWDAYCLVATCDALGIKDYALYRSVLKQLENQSQTKDLNSPEKLHLLKTISLLPPLLSPTLSHQVAVLLSDMFRDASFMSSADHICAWSRALVTVFKCASDETRLYLEESLIALYKYTHVRKDFTLVQIGEILDSWDSIYPSIGPRLFNMWDYVTDKNRSRCNVNELLVAYVYGEQDTEADVKQHSQVRAKLIHRLQQLPVVSSQMTKHSNLLDYDVAVKALSKGSMPARLREALRSLCMTNLDNVGFEFVRSNRENDPKLRKQRCNELSRHLHSTVTNKQKCVHFCALFSNSDEQFLLADHSSIAANFDARCLAALLSTAIGQKIVNNQYSVRDRNIASCVREIANFLNQSHNSLSFSDIFAVIFALAPVSRHHKSAMRLNSMLYEYVEKQVERNSHYLSRADCANLASKMLLTKFYSPKLMNHMVEQTLHNDVTVIDDFYAAQVHHVLRACAMFVYKPAKYSRLIGECRRILRRCLEQKQYDVCVEMLLELSSYGVYPDDELRELFSDDTYRSVLECFSTRNASFKDVINLHHLNVAVVAHRPELGISLSGHTSKYSDGDMSVKSHAVSNNIHRALVTMCGGEECIQTRAMSPLGTLIDFVITLDQNSKPVNGSTSRKSSSSSSVASRRRVAVLSVDRASFAVNDSRVVHCSAHARALKLAAEGYDVVLIMRNTWHLAEDKKAKQLRKIVFGDVKRAAYYVIQ